MKQENNKNQPDVTRARRTGSRKLKARKQPASFLPKNEWDFSSLFGRKDSALLRAAWLWEIDRQTGTDQPPFLCLPKLKQKELAEMAKPGVTVRSRSARVHPAIKEKGRYLLAGPGRTGHYLIINFDGYKFNEIVNAFAKWLNKCQSYLVAEGRMKREKKGRPAEYDSKLRDLGVFRLKKSGCEFEEYKSKKQSRRPQEGERYNPYYLNSQTWHNAHRNAQKEINNALDEYRYEQGLIEKQKKRRNSRPKPIEFDRFRKAALNLTWRQLIEECLADSFRYEDDDIDLKLMEQYGITSKDLEKTIDDAAMENYFSHLIRIYSENEADAKLSEGEKAR
jgi:hypothetical protein